MATRLMPQQDRRRDPRVTERVTFAVRDAGADLVTETKNISASGAYCTLDRFVAPMSKLQLHFELPGRGTHRTQIRCCGVIVRVEPTIAHANRGLYNVAVLFTELSERDRAAITRFVRNRLSAISSAH